MRQRKHKLLIVGTPRSGTKYLADAFKYLGLDLGHENEGHDGAVGYNMALQRARQGKNIKLDECEWVCHVLRDPRYVVPSIKANFKDAMFTHYDPVFGGVAKWWLYWNEGPCLETLEDAKFLGCKTMQFRIEDADKVIPFLADECGAKLAGTDYSGHVLKTTNHRKEYQPYEWADLPLTVQCYAAKYYRPGWTGEDDEDADRKPRSRNTPAAP
jgi:hypothetical protein